MPSVNRMLAGRPQDRALGLVLLLGLLAPTSPVTALEEPIAVLVSPGAMAYRQALAGAQRALDGRAAVIDLAYAGADAARAALVGAGVRAVVAIGPAALALAERLSSTTTVIAVLVPEAAAAPLDPARPVLGVEPFAPPADVLREVAAVSPPGTLWTVVSGRTPPALLDGLRAAVAARGWRLIECRVPDAAAAAQALRDPPPEVGAFLLVPDPVVRNAAFDEALLRLSFERRFPVVGTSRADVQAGALLALLLEPEGLGAQGAALARRALEPAGPPPPARVPPSHLSLIVNAATAERLGLHLPRELLRRAAEVLGR